MFRLLVIILIGVPILELFVLIWVGNWIGAWTTIGLVMITTLIGAWMARKEGLQTMKLARIQLSKGEVPGQALMDGVCILIGGICLLIPGFFTDAIGLFLLIPYTRNIAKAWLRRLFEKWIKKGGVMIIRR